MSNAMDEEDDLRLVRASASLLADLESSLPKILWQKTGRGDPSTRRAHKRIKQHHLDYVVNLIEPFQGEPQLLDAKLKIIVPDLVSSYLQYLGTHETSAANDDLDFETAICTILYTLCKVRGNKVIVGLLNNEPRYLDTILVRLEAVTYTVDQQHQSWHTSYILLLWLSHLLLAPFSLASFSDDRTEVNPVPGIQLPEDTPKLVVRIINIGLVHLPLSTRAQDAAAAMLVRLVVRPDMQLIHLADVLTRTQIEIIEGANSSSSGTIYQFLGPIRFLTGITSSHDLNHLIPPIYRLCEKLRQSEALELIRSNTVAQRLIVKTLRNIAVASLQASMDGGLFQRLLESTSVLENVIDYLLQSLAAQDSSVRYAAAKALSLIIQELDPAIGHEVVQAVLDTYKDDIPRTATSFDFRTVDPLKWHGLTLALSHTLFKRTASPEQLPDILSALLYALQFDQRTATGSSVGSNVRDAANFGIWSLARRYSTEELNLVDTSKLRNNKAFNGYSSVIGLVAVQLILSACLDPVGNIRRGSSAALQELVGRHPNQIHEGISLVQTVEYQAVGLRRRAMCDVAAKAAGLGESYRRALIDAAFEWRGVGSFDLLSRKAAADSIAILSRAGGDTSSANAMLHLCDKLQSRSTLDIEALHGLTLTMSRVLEEVTLQVSAHVLETRSEVLVELLDTLQRLISNCTARILRADLPASIAQLISALCKVQTQASATTGTAYSGLPFGTINSMIDCVLERHETSVISLVPGMILAAREASSLMSYDMLSLKEDVLLQKLSTSSTRSTLNGAARAMALAALYPHLDFRRQTIVTALCELVRATNVDWRTTGLKAINELIPTISPSQVDASTALTSICESIVEGMKDYTIDERGDVGSLVRLQAIACAFTMLACHADRLSEASILILQENVIRISLEKMDRVRLEAAICRARFFPFEYDVTDIYSVSSTAYFKASLGTFLSETSQPSLWKMLWYGCISAAGSSAESLLQSSRSALADVLTTATPSRLAALLSTYLDVMAAILDDKGNMQPALELLAFLLDIGLVSLMRQETFKWKTLLSIVQKAHFKSSELPRILAAVHVYHGLARAPKVRADTVKKLLSMLKTNPYPRVRMAVVDVLYLVLADDELLGEDWTVASPQRDALLLRLQKQHVDGS